MADLNAASRKNVNDHEDIASKSGGTDNPKPSTSTDKTSKQINVNTSGPNKSERAGDLETANTNVSSNSDNHEEAIDSNLSPDLNRSKTIKNVSRSSDQDKLGKNKELDEFFDDKQTEDTAKTQRNEVKKIDDSTSSHKHGRTDKKNTSSHHNKPKEAADSDNTSDTDEPNGSDISYQPKERDLLDSVLKNGTNNSLINRLLGCAYGQALGDAYGLSTEFEDRRRVAQNYPDPLILIPFPDYVLTGHSRRWTRGDWTDDTDQWILILDTLTEHKGDVKVFAKKLKNWIRNGYPELGDHGGMGLGANVSQVVHSPDYTSNPLDASKKVWERSQRQAAPNGAVMRCSASAFVHFNDLEQVKSTTILMCKATHFDPRCIASCLAVNLAITYLLTEDFDNNNIEQLIERVQEETIEILGDSFPEEHRKTFLWHTQVRTLEELNLDESQSIGYTYKCLASGFYGLRSKDTFEKTLNDLIRYGGDADTNGAVCGTMYGARYGYKALPYPWLRAMPNKKWFDKKIIKCFQQMNLTDTETMETN